jgi:Capsular polysaccharide biosynthesis protein
MCRQAVNEGVHTIVSAQLWDINTDELPPDFDEHERRLLRLQSEMSGSNTLALKQGFVLRFGPKLPALIETYGASITLGGGRFVLVALPALRVPVETEEIWARLAQQGFTAIVAGPECSPALRRDEERLEKWLALGVRLQLNAASITGAHGRDARRFAFHYIKKYPSQLVVASNAREAGARTPSLSSARAAVLSRFGKSLAHALFEANPAAILKTSPASAAAEETRTPRGPSSLLQQLFKLKKAATDTV